MRYASFLAFLTLSLPAIAQVPVSLVGRVERQTAGCSAAAYRITCSDTQLTSSTINLATYVNQVVQIEGTANYANPACPSVEVTAVTAAPISTRVFALSGYRLGAPLIITTTAPLGSAVAYLFSTESALVPLGPLGTYQLDLLGTVYWTFDISIGVAIRSVNIPRDTFLLGQRLLFQTVYATVTPQLGAQFLNLNCGTITQ